MLYWEFKKEVAEHVEAYLKSMVTADKSWLHHYAQPRNQQIFLLEKKANVVKSSEKVMVLSSLRS